MSKSRRTFGCLLPVFLATAPAFSQTVSDQLIVRFAPGVLQAPPGRTSGAIEEFSFSTLEARNALVNEGVGYLTGVFPRFKSEDCLSKNLIGDPILLEDLSGFYSASLRPGTSVDADARVRSIPGVINAEWPRLGRLLSADQHFDKQWGLHNPGPPVCSPYNGPPPVADSDSLPTDINAPEAWSIEKGLNLSVRVGILDTGIHASHQDFGGRVASGVTFLPVAPPPPCPEAEPCAEGESCTYGPFPTQDDDNGHGTSVAGVVAATGDNGIGVAGVAWGVTLVPIKMAGCDPQFSSCNSARALDWARTEGIPTLNMSYNTGGPTALERAAVRNAFYSGQLLVAAAGNDNNGSIIYPAKYAKMVCAVGAYFMNGRRWRDELIGGGSPLVGSCYGSEMDLAAPGGRMVATTDFGGRCLNDQYDYCPNGFSGTSSAAPVVSGVAALILSKYKAKGATGADEPLIGEDLYQTMIITALGIPARQRGP